MGAILTGANLIGANLNGADLKGVDLTEAIAAETTFTYGSLHGIKDLTRVRHDGPSSIGIDTLERTAADLTLGKISAGSVGGGLSMSQCCLLCQPGAVGGSGGSRAGGGF